MTRSEDGLDQYRMESGDRPLTGQEQRIVGVEILRIPELEPEVEERVPMRTRIGHRLSGRSRRYRKFGEGVAERTPQIAEEWGVSPDGATVTELRGSSEPEEQAK